MLFGWPSRVALLLHESTRYQVLAELKAHYDTNEELKAMDSRHLRGMLLRCPFRLRCVRQIVEPFRANCWAANHRVLETISLREGGFKQSVEVKGRRGGGEGGGWWVVGGGVVVCVCLGCAVSVLGAWCVFLSWDGVVVVCVCVLFFGGRGVCCSLEARGGVCCS